jgi:CHASE2 domain-containing sensor protein
MAEKPASSITEKSSTVVKAGRQLQVLRWSYWFTGTSAVVSGLLMVFAGGWVGWMETQVITTWFQLRGSTIAPDDIVIVAIDDQSISLPEQSYKIDPLKYADLEPLKSFPYKRDAYGKIIDKLIKAGAKTVALDIVFDQPSYKQYYKNMGIRLF